MIDIKLVSETPEPNSLWLGDRPVKAYGKVPLEDVDQYWVTYSDELKPQGEVVHSDEWELKTEKPNIDRQSYFVSSIQGIQKNVLKELVGHNILWADVQSTMNWVLESILKVRNELNNLLFKTENWESELTPKKCLKALEEFGAEVKPSDLNEVEKIIYNHLIETDVSLPEIKQGFQSVLSLKKIAEAVFELQVQALEACVGSPVDRWRMASIEEAIEKLRQKEHEAPKNTEDVQGNSGNDKPSESGGEDPAVGDAQPAV